MPASDDNRLGTYLRDRRTRLDPAAFGANQWLVEDLYQQYLRDRSSVDPAWWDFFDGYAGGTSQAPAASAHEVDEAPAPTPPEGTGLRSGGPFRRPS